jgi:hypothetical protein
MWGAHAIQFVGYVVDRDGIHVEQGQVQAVKHWPTPTYIRYIQQFLGLTGFY